MDSKITSIYEAMSKAELVVAGFLKEMKMYWNYEQPIYVTDDKGRPRGWTPDFYLP